MSKETFALAYVEDYTCDVALWCLPLSRNGSIEKFEVLNGGWFGEFNHDTGIVSSGSDLCKAYEVWRGKVPIENSRDYNEAIAWINDQVQCDLQRRIKEPKLCKIGHTLNFYFDPKSGKTRPLYLRDQSGAIWERTAVRENWWNLGHLKPAFAVRFKGYKLGTDERRMIDEYEATHGEVRSEL